jgi:hypothetical protein
MNSTRSMTGVYECSTTARNPLADEDQPDHERPLLERLDAQGDRLAAQADDGADGVE